MSQLELKNNFSSVLDGLRCTVQPSFSVAQWLQNATEELKRLEEAFNAVRQNILSRLHEVVRDQLFAGGEQKAGIDASPKRLSQQGMAPMNGSSAPKSVDLNAGRNKDASTSTEKIVY